MQSRVGMLFVPIVPTGGNAVLSPLLRACLPLALFFAGPTAYAQQPLGKTVIVHSKDEYAEIDTSATKALLGRLRGNDAAIRNAALTEAKNAPNVYAPPVLFEIANDLYAKGQPEEATYWYLLARLRSGMDGDILLDETAKSGITELVLANRQGFSAYLPQHTQEAWKQLNRAVDWDRANSPKYDRRWLALHGIRAISSALPGSEDIARERDEITIPQSQ